MKTHRCVTGLAAGLLSLGLVGATVAAAPSDAASTHDVASRAKATKTFTATLKAGRAQLDAKGKLVLTGTVTPAVKGGTVKIQKQLAGKHGWKLEKKVTMGSSGRFTYKDFPSTAGVRHYRAVVPGQHQIKGGKSKAVKVTVYRWLDLSKVAARSQSNTSRYWKIAIDGHAYESGLSGANYDNVDQGFMDWNLGRSCTSLKARLGNGDLSDETASATISIVKDGDTTYTHTYALTESQQKTFDLKNVFRLKFAWTSADTAGDAENQGGAQAVLAEPQVHCAF